MATEGDRKPLPPGQVVSTGYTTCALRANGEVVCWGNNFYGTLGTGSFDQPEEKISTPSKQLQTGLSGGVPVAHSRPRRRAAKRC